MIKLGLYTGVVMCRPGSEKGTVTNCGHSERRRGHLKSPELPPDALGTLEDNAWKTQLSFLEVRRAGAEGQTLTPPRKVP